MPSFIVETAPQNRTQVHQQLSQVGASEAVYLEHISRILLRDIWVLSGDALSFGSASRLVGAARVELDQEYVFFVNQALNEARETRHEPLPGRVQDFPLGAQGMNFGRPIGGAEFLTRGGLGPILDRIGVPAAWATTRGDGATIVIMDSGVDGRLVMATKRAGSWTDGTQDPWQDQFGHGTMMALMAAGSGGSNGFAGAAPQAKIFSMRPAAGPNGGILKSGILKGYEHIIALIENGEMGPTVILNGWGIYGCLSPRSICEDVLARVVQVINRRACTVWAAGNSRNQCGTLTNGILGYASMERSLSSGALDSQLRPQPYSSRGPGQCAPLHPTVSVPTHGILPWGAGFLDFGSQGGGTSSAAAMLAGVVALLYSVVPEITAQQIGELLRSSAAPLGREFEPQTGAGLLQAQRALDSLMKSPVVT